MIYVVKNTIHKNTNYICLCKSQTRVHNGRNNFKYHIHKVCKTGVVMISYVDTLMVGHYGIN